jgi:hypothetical protein
MIDHVTGNKPLAGEHQTGHCRAYRRHSTVLRGNDEGGVGSGERRRRAKPPPPVRPRLSPYLPAYTPR